MTQLIRAFDWTAYMLRRYVFEWIAWLIGSCYFWVVLKISMAVDWIGYTFLFLLSRFLYFIGLVITKTFGSPAVISAVASAGEAQGRAMEFGARKIFAVAEAPIWKRVFFAFANLYFRIEYAFGLARWWIWEKTFGSHVAHAAVSTAEQVPERAIGIGLQQLETIQSSWLGRAFTSVIRVVRRPLNSVFQFVFGWLLTRNFRILWGVIPVLLLAAPFAYIAVRIPFTSIEARANTYREAAEKARDKGDEVKADLFERKLAQMNIQDEGYDYRRAIQNEAVAGIEETYQRMLELAPHDRSGFPRAHRWIGMALRANAVELEDGLDLAATIEHHLNEYLSNESGDPAALQVMAELQLKKGDKSRSLAYLRRIDTADLPATDLIRLASSFVRAEETASAERLAAKALVGFEKTTADDRNAELFLHWIAAERILGDHNGLASVLLDATERLPATEHEQFLPVAIRTLKTSSRFDNAGRFASVAKRIVRAFPRNNEIGKIIIKECDDLDSARRLNTVLATEMRDGLVPKELVGKIGDFYAAAGLGAEARDVYGRFHTVDDTDIRIINNLAWLWATAEPRDLHLAMGFADEAIALEPNRDFARETRGQILFLLQRYSEAKDDLTKALNGLPDYAPIHETLAKCYQKLGDQELSEQHAKMAKQLSQTVTP